MNLAHPKEQLKFAVVWARVAVLSGCGADEHGVESKEEN